MGPLASIRHVIQGPPHARTVSANTFAGSLSIVKDLGDARVSHEASVGANSPRRWGESGRSGRAGQGLEPESEC
jgi:hypothetical protein